jgi:hypothetical protein
MPQLNAPNGQNATIFRLFLENEFIPTYVFQLGVALAGVLRCGSCLCATFLWPIRVLDISRRPLVRLAPWRAPNCTATLCSSAESNPRGQPACPLNSPPPSSSSCPFVRAPLPFSFLFSSSQGLRAPAGRWQPLHRHGRPRCCTGHPSSPICSYFLLVGFTKGSAPWIRSLLLWCHRRRLLLPQPFQCGGGGMVVLRQKGRGGWVSTSDGGGSG